MFFVWHQKALQYFFYRSTINYSPLRKLKKKLGILVHHFFWWFFSFRVFSCTVVQGVLTPQKYPYLPVPKSKLDGFSLTLLSTLLFGYFRIHSIKILRQIPHHFDQTILQDYWIKWQKLEALHFLIIFNKGYGYF